MAADSLVDEIKAIRKKNNGATIAIDDVVARYVPAGTSKTAALTILEKNGFKCFPSRAASGPKNSANQETITCILDMKKPHALGFGDEVVANLYFEDEAVSRLTARIIYRAL